MNRRFSVELYCLPIEFNFCPIEKTHILLPVISAAIQQNIETRYFFLHTVHTCIVAVSDSSLQPVHFCAVASEGLIINVSFSEIELLTPCLIKNCIAYLNWHSGEIR